MAEGIKLEQLQTFLNNIVAKFWRKSEAQAVSFMGETQEVGSLPVDTTPTTGSTNLVTSGGVKSALDAKGNGTVTSVSVKMNGTTKGTVTTIGTIDLGTVITAHQDISGKLDKNTSITGATKCKITYDSKGLVTGGSDLAASDIPDLPASKVTSGTMSASRLPVANGSQAGIVSTGAQTFNGQKTFANATTFNDYAIIANGKDLQFKNTSGTNISAVLMNSTNTMAFGYGAATNGYTVEYHGGVIHFKVGTNHDIAAILDASKNLTVEGQVIGKQGVAAQGISDLAIPSIGGGSATEYKDLIHKNVSVSGSSYALTADSEGYARQYIVLELEEGGADAITISVTLPERNAEQYLLLDNWDSSKKTIGFTFATGTMIGDTAIEVAAGQSCEVSVIHTVGRDNDGNEESYLVVTSHDIAVE